mgnify:CR=1 FL=1
MILHDESFQLSNGVKIPPKKENQQKNHVRSSSLILLLREMSYCIPSRDNVGECAFEDIGNYLMSVYSFQSIIQYILCVYTR